MRMPGKRGRLGGLVRSADCCRVVMLTPSDRGTRHRLSAGRPPDTGGGLQRGDSSPRRQGPASATARVVTASAGPGYRNKQRTVSMSTRFLLRSIDPRVALPFVALAGAVLA